jgi:hypothetical protein
MLFVERLVASFEDTITSFTSLCFIFEISCKCLLFVQLMLMLIDLSM